MRIDRIFIDIFDWIRRVLYYQADKATQKPYEVLSTKYGNRGYLRKLLRDTERAVATWEYQLYRRRENDGYKLYKYHIYVDFLEPITNKDSFKLVKVPSYRNRPTHRVSIVMVDPVINKDGTYNTDILFAQDYSFQRYINRRDYEAKWVAQKLAEFILDRKPSDILNINWAFEIDLIYKQISAGLV